MKLKKSLRNATFPIQQLPVDPLEKSLFFRTVPLLWAQPCPKQASACNLAVCSLLSLSPLASPCTPAGELMVSELAASL